MWSQENASLNFHPRWLAVLRDGLRHVPYAIEAVEEGRVVGLLPLAFVSSRLFGKFLCSLPYVNAAGVCSANEQAAQALINRAVELADRLGVKHLELRHEIALPHEALVQGVADKVHMRLPLPATNEAFLSGLKAKVRNQVKNGEKRGFNFDWGGVELLDDFYGVFSRNMRDLGTPVFSRRLFQSILQQFANRAELCVVRAGSQPIAAALLTHGLGVTEVPSASCLRDFHSSNANMFMYSRLLERAIARGQQIFDFGRSTPGGNTHRFKKQWGALESPAVWQYYVRRGRPADMRRESGKYDRFIRVWRRLPLTFTRVVGPLIVRGIP